jgi:hypothetical protein
LRKPREAGCAPETRQAQAHPTDEEIITRRQQAVSTQKCSADLGDARVRVEGEAARPSLYFIGH